MRKALQQSFFARDVHTVARELLGKELVCAIDGKERSFVITETESYDGPEDKACHASDTPTERTKVMFGPPGHFYIYLIYGMYDMLNIVTGEEGYPSAVLIRGVEGHDGPGKLTRDIGINRSLNAEPVTPQTGLWVREGDIVVADENVETTPRIGIDYAEEWADKPYRFVLKGVLETKK